MIFCARATRGLRRMEKEWPSALLARRARNKNVLALRAVEDSLGHSLEER